jgi:nitrite reductase/ring-hydroxylating ferredoxin subunit
MNAAATTGELHALASLGDLPIGEGRAFAVGTEQIAVFRTRSGQVHALSAVCPHAGGPIADGQSDGRVVVCPLHQHAYELRSGCSTTGQPPLRSFPVHVDEAGTVVIEIPAR